VDSPKEEKETFPWLFRLLERSKRIKLLTVFDTSNVGKIACGNGSCHKLIAQGSKVANMFSFQDEFWRFVDVWKYGMFGFWKTCIVLIGYEYLSWILEIMFISSKIKVYVMICPTYPMPTHPSKK